MTCAKCSANTHAPFRSFMFSTFAQNIRVGNYEVYVDGKQMTHKSHVRSFDVFIESMSDHKTIFVCVCVCWLNMPIAVRSSRFLVGYYLRLDASSLLLAIVWLSSVVITDVDRWWHVTLQDSVTTVVCLSTYNHLKPKGKKSNGVRSTLCQFVWSIRPNVVYCSPLVVCGLVA